MGAATTWFEDTTAKTGVAFTLLNSATAEKHQIESMAGGVAAFDFDNDGRVDLFFANGAKQPSLEKTDASYWNRLYRNRGGGAFEDVTEKAGVAGAGYSIAAATADYDNDGFADLFVAGVNRNILYRNRGDGTFEDVTAKAGVGNQGRWAVAAGWFDYDNDGRLDLLVVNYVKWDPAKEPFCGDAKAGYRSYCHPKFYEGLPNTLYRNNGDGTFTDVSEKSGIGRHIGKGMGVAFADYDGDGAVDVFVANDTVPNFLFHNEGERDVPRGRDAGGSGDERRRPGALVDGRRLPRCRQRRAAGPIRDGVDERDVSAVPESREGRVRGRHVCDADRGGDDPAERLERGGV